VRHLGGRFRVIAFDTRGHGDSQTLPGKAECAWRLAGQDIHTVLDALNIDRPIFAAGHSAGAAHIAYAEDMQPGRFAKVILLDAIIGPGFIFQGERPLAVSARRRTNVFDDLALARARFASKPPMSRWVGTALDSYLQHGLCSLPNGQVELKLPGDKEAWFYEQGGASDLFERLEKVHLEMMLVTGSESDVAPLVKLQSEMLPRAYIRSIAGASHFIPQEKPASVAALMLDYFTD